MPCDCGALDCTKCRPFCDSPVECARCGELMPSCAAHECRRCREDICEACAVGLDGLCASCAENAGAQDADGEHLVGIRDALLRLGVTGDSLFAGIREDLERGLVREARQKLDFVDIIITANTDGQTRDGSRVV